MQATGFNVPACKHRLQTDNIMSLNPSRNDVYFCINDPVFRLSHKRSDKQVFTAPLNGGF
jgi:hypothetical protein